ncbi:MAG: tetratricopeptide repeat protein [Scytonematopsis contorta HA4267-MV1]|jgi:tetratricopeptide (TPR) repeat protein|nr:tetratricopeptide repeat protein [Scytonematopsis contorta HA4267-MV1]
MRKGLKSLNIIFTAYILCLACSSGVLADSKKPTKPDKFPPNPLEITTPDQLLPRSPKDKTPLTPEERQRLQLALDELNQQAATQLQSGNKTGAFDTWNRELRLRKFLGPLAEVQALTRVGEIAWRENERQQVQYITQRLEKIQKSAQSQQIPELPLLQALGQAYQKVRSLKPALQVYDQILGIARSSRDAAGELDALNAIAKLNLDWFDYPKAAVAYEQLLSLANSSSDSVSQVNYLQQLAYIYTQTKQHQQSVNVRSKLADFYLKENNLVQLATLKLEIGLDYEALGKENPNVLQEAFKSYQEAYQMAWGLQQYVTSSEALRRIVALYRNQGQIQEALQTSEILLKTEEFAANSYGLMSAYDLIGQIYLDRKDNQQALTAFQKGLELANQLNHNQEYFNQQIAKASKS